MPCRLPSEQEDAHARSESARNAPAGEAVEPRRLAAGLRTPEAGAGAGPLLERAISAELAQRLDPGWKAAFGVNLGHSPATPEAAWVGASSSTRARVFPIPGPATG